jgi:hypothetical protein
MCDCHTDYGKERTVIVLSLALGCSDKSKAIPEPLNRWLTYVILLVALNLIKILV